MDYRLELLDEDTFEKLVNTICQKLLGMGVISFAAGKDGGRDGKFTGTGENYPDKTKPWNGKFIIQSKHTANPTASCADPDFDRLITKEEIPKIKKLKADGEIDCYMLFTKRKYSGVSGEALLKKLKKETGLDNVVIIGKEVINDLYINPNRHIITLFQLNKHHIPFDFSDEEIKDIILAFKTQFEKIESDLKEKIDKVKYDFDFLAKEAKNEKNQLGKEYYQNVVLSNSLMDFDKIQHFLDDAKNSEFKQYYFDTTLELKHIITIQRDNFGAFEEIFDFVYQKICSGNINLKGSKRHVMTLLHYMYWECLIGVK
jgi:hypothetical protein